MITFIIDETLDEEFSIICKQMETSPAEFLHLVMAWVVCCPAEADAWITHVMTAANDNSKEATEDG